MRERSLINVSYINRIKSGRTLCKMNITHFVLLKLFNGDNDNTEMSQISAEFLKFSSSKKKNFVYFASFFTRHIKM